jgi:hypothetical protein
MKGTGSLGGKSNEDSLNYKEVAGSADMPADLDWFQFAYMTQLNIAFCFERHKSTSQSRIYMKLRF